MGAHDNASVASGGSDRRAVLRKIAVAVAVAGVSGLTLSRLPELVSASNNVPPSGTATFDGPVGIGTTSPNELLHVYGGSGNIGMRFENGSNTSSDYLAQRYMMGGSEKAVVFTHLNDMTFRVNSGNLILNDAGGNVGIGTTSPAGRFHVESALDTVGTVHRLPAHPGIPPGGDPSYRHRAVMQWEGGEAKFGKWRQYFNAFEQDWALAYNAPWDYTNNTWLGRDSGDSRANICACMRFNVAEGNSGENVFEIWFAPPASAGTVPDWNAASTYTFFDGRNPAIGSPKGARLRISGAASMEAILSLSSHSTVNPFVVNLVSDGLNNIFRIRNAFTETDYLSILRDSGNVGIGTTTPTSKLQVNGRVKAQGYDTGDITYANGMKTKEEGDGLAFLNAKGNKIAVLDADGNLHLKGKIIQDL